jgi:Lamin Tail Domain
MNRLHFPPFALLLFFSARLFAQISDNFSDGNFTANPAWQGDVANFIVNPDGELQLKAAAEGSSVLAVQGVIPDSAVWELRFQLKFPPSSQNLLRIYLLADQANLAQANGYFLEIGETGSNDAIRMFRQNGAVKTLLATGQAASVATNPNIRLRAQRTRNGAWRLEAGPVGGVSLLQFNTSDAAFGGGPNRFFGFQCIYTTGNKENFSFDDLDIRVYQPDKTPPAPVSAQAENATTLNVVFNEVLDSLSAVKTGNYTIVGLGQPVSAVLLPGKNMVRLTLGQPLGNGSFTLQTNNITDAVGNTSGLQSVNFQYFNLQGVAEFDVLINEIMSDPEPTRGLPDAEWLELYNRSDKFIDLKTLRIDDGGTPQALPTFVMPPKSYATLCSPNAAAALGTAAKNVVVVPAFPSLNNSGETLTLTEAASGLTVDRVPFKLDWHTDKDKKDGGWSLERVNPGTPCIGSANWQSAAQLPGGTPGSANFAFSNAPDTQKPRLLDAYPTDARSIRLTFSEGLDKNDAVNPALYQITPTRAVAAAALNPLDRAVVTLTLGDALQPAAVYALRVVEALRDCSGNGAVSTDTLYLGLPEKPGKKDIVVNEILFNPATGGARYVEFFNRSNKILSWEDLFVANFKESDFVLVGLQRLLLPGRYDVFTTDPDDLKTRFAGIRAADVLPFDLPSLADDAGNIAVYYSKNGETIVLDSFDYQEDYHNALFNDSEREGVALERIRTEEPTNIPANWTSAAPVPTGAPGTPTLPNSQRLSGPDRSADNLIFLPIERLSPDDDGFEDFLDIQYKLPATGYAASVQIFDSEGIPVRRLLRQELAGTEGGLRWDGEAEDGEKARPGIYILFMEIFAPTGETKRVKKAFAVVGRF